VALSLTLPSSNLKLPTISYPTRAHGIIVKYTPFQWNNKEFKKLLRLLQQKRHFKIELCVRLTEVFRDYSMFITLFKISEVHFRLLGIIGFHVKAKNE